MLRKAIAHAKKSVKKEKHARGVHHRAVKHHNKAKKAERHARHVRANMHKLRKAARAHHHKATAAFRKSLAALRRSKKHAIKAHHAVVAHAMKGIKAGHI